MAYAARDLSVHVYLPQCVIIGSVFTAIDSLIEFLDVGGEYIHVHNAMWVPYREGGSVTRAREALLNKRDVLFVVHRTEQGSNTAGGPRESWLDASLAVGPFLLKGRVGVGTLGTLHGLMTSEAGFIEVREVSIAGPLGGTFSEPSALIQRDKVSFIAAQ